MSATMRTGAQQLGRRDFLRTSAAVSSGLWISAWVPELAGAAAKTAAAAGKVFAPNAFVRIAADESVTVIANHSEMGQGIYTSLPMLLNEELEADWSKITVEPAPVDAAYNHTVFGLQMTGGSTTTPSEWERFRRMGAMARVMIVEAAETLRIPGVRAVEQVPSGVTVVAEKFWAAKVGRDKLKITWDDGENAALSTTKMREEFSKLSATPGAIARKAGDPAAALATAAKTISAEYDVPYLAHAMMEPLNCVVDLHSDSCEIWTGTQFETVDRLNAAKVAGLPPEKVQIHTTLLGGGFGRRANPASDFVVEAMHVAKVAKAPVKVVWTREDDLAGGWYRPMWHDRFAAGLDADGNPIAWTHTIVGQSITQGTPFEAYTIKDGVDSTSVEGAADILYGIPNLQVDLHSPKIGVPVQWWRSVGHSHTGFSVEGFFDEVAHAGGKDPFELRRKLLANQPRMLAVLELAAEKAGWGKPLAKGRGRGIATHFSFDSYVAQVVEASVEKDGTVRVYRVVCAVDCGRAINPDVVKAQMEGGIIFGLTAALKTEITLEQGRVQQTNFHDYPMLRMCESPEIEVHIVPSEANPTGVGEPGVPPVASALANAIFAATGKRIRRLPIQTSELAG